MGVGKVVTISHGSEGVTSVSDGEITVDKIFVADEFPVSAIKLVVRSTRDEATRIRVIDRIPKSFPMESAGFHPDFENDSWTACKDHRVEYERMPDPGEELVTVYDIRVTDGRGQTDFLGESTFERIPVDGGIGPDDIDDTLGEDRNQIARDMLVDNCNPPCDESDADDADLEGEGEIVLDAPADPDSEAGAADVAETDVTAASTADAVDDKPSDGDLATAFAGGGDGETDPEATEARVADDGDKSVPIPSSDNGVLGDDEETGNESAESTGPHVVATDTAPAVTAYLGQSDVDVKAEAVDADVETDADTGAAGSTPAPDADGLAGALAAETRSDVADEDDLEITREAVDAETRRSIDVRIHRLQSQMEGIVAYSDTFAEPIDEEGIGSDLVSEFRVEVAISHEGLDALDSMVDDTTESVNNTTSRLDAAEETVTTVDDRSDRVTTQVANAESHPDDHDGRLEGLASDLDTTEDTLDGYHGWLESHNEQFGTVEGRLGDHGERLKATSRNTDAGLDRPNSVEETLAKREEELVTARKRLNDIAGRLDETVDQLEGAGFSVAGATEQVSTFHDEVGDVHEDITDLDGDIMETWETLSGRLMEIQSRVEDAAIDEKIEALHDDIRELNDTVAEPETFRECFTGAFGTGMGGDPATGDNDDTDGAE